MLSILHSEPEIGPKIRKKIRLLTLLTAPFWICTVALLLMCCLMPDPPRRLFGLLGIACGITSFLSGGISRLRYPRRT